MDTNINYMNAILEIRKYSSSNVAIIYDGDCPICSNIMIYSDLKDRFRSVELLNARFYKDLTCNLNKKYNLNLNDGMIVVVEDNLFFGGEALHFIGLNSTKKTFVGKIISLIYRWKFISNTMYPLFRFLRLLLLKILRRQNL